MSKVYMYFEHDFYINKYEDVKNFNYNKAYNHFMNIGIKENRLYNKQLINFNYIDFLNYNPSRRKYNYLLNTLYFLEYLKNNNDCIIYNKYIENIEPEYCKNKYIELKYKKNFEIYEYFLTEGLSKNKIYNKLLENYNNSKPKPFELFMKDTTEYIRTLKCQNNILLIMDSDINYGIKTHTDILYNIIKNCDIKYIKSSTGENVFDISIINNYNTVIFQHIQYPILIKYMYQKFIYIVHCNIQIFSNTTYIYKIIDKNIDKYIFVSKNIEKKFLEVINDDKILLKDNRKIILENCLPIIINEQKIKDGLYVCGVTISYSKNILKLIKDFINFCKNNSEKFRTLRIMGKILDIKYYDEIKEYIDDNKDNKYDIIIEDQKERYEYLEILKEAEYYCMYSHSEGCSYSILEAISLNKKIICSTECITTEFISNYKNLRNTFEEFEIVENLDENYINNNFNEYCKKIKKELNLTI